MVEIVHVDDDVHDDDANKKVKDRATNPSVSLKDEEVNVMELTPLQREGLRRTCNACGLPPRNEIPLKRCSICKEVWYHDRQCQHSDFPTHKKVCKRILKEKQETQQKREQQFLTTTKQQQQQQKLCCRVVLEEEDQESTFGSNGRRRKGRYLVANQRLSYGTVVGPKNATTTTSSPNNGKSSGSNPNNHWDPMAVVLLENHRRHRCLVCFGLILEHHQTQQQQQQDDDDDDIPLYPTKLCSSACRRKSASFLPSEKQAIRKLLQEENSPPMILPTAVLLYRLVLFIERDKSGQTKKILSELQSEKEATPQSQQTEEDEQEKAHQQAVTHTTWAMIKAIGTLPLWNFEDLTALLNQIKLNGFSICTPESVALGIGIYTTNSTTPRTPTSRAPPSSSSSSSTATSTFVAVGPNLINHNCQPNLLQTFDYGVVGCYPTLRLTVCTPGGININDELTISYIDNTMPTVYKQQRLQKDYGFHCTCCEECRSCRRLGTNNDNDEELGNNQKKDDDILQSIQSDDRQVLARVYQELKQKQQKASKTTTYTRSSSSFGWYLQECGERLLQILLDDLGEATASIMDEYGGHDDTAVRQKQYALAAQAFQLTEELLQLTATTTDNKSTTTTQDKQKDSTVVRKTILRYKSVKLRLFLNVNPQQAMQELENKILPICNTFFPGHHEVMKQIVQDCCL